MLCMIVGLLLRETYVLNEESNFSASASPYIVFSMVLLLNQIRRDFNEIHSSQVARLQEQLQKERELRTALETGLGTSQRQLAVSSTIDEKVITAHKNN